MSLAFNTKPTATVKAKSTEGGFISMSGCTNGPTTPANAANQMNKILDIGGKAVVADKNMTRTQTEEVVEDE